jgi:hypothetical protein
MGIIYRNGVSDDISFSAKKKTAVAERLTSPGKGKVNPLLKIAAKKIASRAAKAVAKKALAKAGKKSAKRSAR